MSKQYYVNIADLLPVKMLLDKHVSPKSVVNVFAAMEIPIETIEIFKIIRHCESRFFV